MFSLRNLKSTGNMLVELLVRRESVSTNYETNSVLTWIFPMRLKRRRRRVPKRRSPFTRSPRSRSVTTHRLRDRADTMIRSPDARRMSRKPRSVSWLRSRDWLVFLVFPAPDRLLTYHIGRRDIGNPQDPRPIPCLSDWPEWQICHSARGEIQCQDHVPPGVLGKRRKQDS